MQFISLIIFGFIAMEAISYFGHRFLFHGVLWRIHRTHHQPRKSFLEPNDIFSVIFTVGTIGLMVFAEKPLTNSISFPVGAGIAIYGLVYFVAHDFFTHRRFAPFKSKNRILQIIRRAHQRHHQMAEKIGVEPFGLFVFDYAKFGVRITRNKKAKTAAKIN